MKDNVGCFCELNVNTIETNKNSTGFIDSLARDECSGGESSLLYINWSLVIMSLLIIQRSFCIFLLGIFRPCPAGFYLHLLPQHDDLNFNLLLFVISLTLFVISLTFFVLSFHCSPHNYPSSPALPTLISQTTGPDLLLGCLCCCLAISRHVLLAASQGTTRGWFLCWQKCHFSP